MISYNDEHSGLQTYRPHVAAGSIDFLLVRKPRAWPWVVLIVCLGGLLVIGDVR